MSETGLDSSFFFFLFCWRFIVVWSNFELRIQELQKLHSVRKASRGSRMEVCDGGGHGMAGVNTVPTAPPLPGPLPSRCSIAF